MVVEHYLKGYDEFKNFMSNLGNDGKKVHIYFTGSKMPSGKSWCDDCQKAQPILEQALAVLDPNNSTYEIVYVEVGDRSYWKDMDNPFRKDPDAKLLVIPTLIRWKGPQRLEGEQCEKLDLVEMLLTDEE